MMATTRRRAARVAPEHLEFWDTLREFVRTELEPLLPQLGTIVGEEGGRVRVKRDGDDEAAVLGVARNKGIRHQSGDRVVTIPTPSGERAVIAVLSTGDGPGGRRAIGDSELHDNAVTNRALGANSVDSAKLQSNSVVRTHLTPGLIGNEHLGSASVGTPNIQNGSVIRDKIAKNAVSGNELAGGAVDTPHLTSRSVTSDKIATNAVTSSELASGAVGSSQLSNNAVDTSKVANGAITPAKLSESYAPKDHTHGDPTVTVNYNGTNMPIQDAIRDIDRRLDKAGV